MIAAAVLLGWVRVRVLHGGVSLRDYFFPFASCANVYLLRQERFLKISLVPVMLKMIILV